MGKRYDPYQRGDAPPDEGSFMQAHDEGRAYQSTVTTPITVELPDGRYAIVPPSGYSSPCAVDGQWVAGVAADWAYTLRYLQGGQCMGTISIPTSEVDKYRS